MTWVEYLKCLRDNCMKLLEADPEKSKSLDDKDFKIQSEVSSSRPVDEVKCKKEKPLNIKDKHNKYCNQCDITFGSRILFLKHCQNIHKLRFKNRSGGPLILDRVKKMFEVNVQREVEVNSKASLKFTENRDVQKNIGFGRSNKSDGVISSDQEIKSEVLSFDNQIEVEAMSSSYINTFSTPDREGSNQSSLSNEDGALIETNNQGFKCYKCGRAYKKMGNLTKHLTTC